MDIRGAKVAHTYGVRLTAIRRPVFINYQA